MFNKVSPAHCGTVLFLITNTLAYKADGFSRLHYECGLRGVARAVRRQVVGREVERQLLELRQVAWFRTPGWWERRAQAIRSHTRRSCVFVFR